MKILKPIDFKRKRKFGFRLYFTLFVSIILFVAVASGLAIENLMQDWINNSLHIPGFIIIAIFSLIIGVVAAWFVAKFALNPIKRIRNAMSEVSEGNFNVTVPETGLFAEIEDINHDFNAMVKELRSTEIIQSDFVSGVSHEFKTPLTAIEGYTTMLQSDDLSEEEKKE